MYCHYTKTGRWLTALLAKLKAPIVSAQEYVRRTAMRGYIMLFNRVIIRARITHTTSSTSLTQSSLGERDIDLNWLFALENQGSIARLDCDLSF